MKRPNFRDHSERLNNRSWLAPAPVKMFDELLIACDSRYFDFFGQVDVFLALSEAQIQAASIRATTIQPPTPKCSCETMIGAAIRLTRLTSLIIGFKAGPAVSFSGSPTVSPTTAACAFQSPCRCWRQYCVVHLRRIFLALSQAPPALAMNTARSCPHRITPAGTHPGPQPVEPTNHERSHDGDGRQRDQLFLSRLGRNTDYFAVIRSLGAFHNSRDAELPAYFLHNLGSCTETALMEES